MALARWAVIGRDIDRPSVGAKVGASVGHMRPDAYTQ